MWTFERVKTNSVVKWAVRALGVIILGAFGSGLSETALKPALVRASYGLMNLSSLGMESVRTGIYQRISAGSTASAGVHTLALVTILMVILYVSLFGGSFMLRWSIRGTHENEEKTLQQERRFLKSSRWALYGA